MNNTRYRILQTLINFPKSTINHLAESVGINAISVRHHLSSLMAEGLIIAEEERHGVGRPRQVYSLTEKGLERFPSRYLDFTDRIIEQLKSSLSEESLNQLFINIATRLSDTYKDQVSHLSLEGKLEFIKNALNQEGFSMSWEKLGNEYFIHEITCPYYYLSKNHPEICVVDQTVLSRLLSIPVEKVKSISLGDTRCTYLISALNTKVKQ
jgi:DeoR family transcriptional regulator, suf operon transcriptional repressor